MKSMKLAEWDTGPRRVACDSCGSRRGETCRSMTGRRVGRAVSYTHKARVVRWNKLRRRNKEFPFDGWPRR